MTDYDTVNLATAALIAGLMLGTWALSIARRDASIVDTVWALAFVLVAWTSFALADGSDARKTLVVALTTVWGLRLTFYMWWRKRSEEEDFRYQEMRRRHGKRFPLVSLFRVFGLQGLAIWAVSLPVQAAQVPGSPSGLTVLDFAGIALWGVGMVFEVGGDLQLRRFKADPRNRGRVMDRGLWRYTRHPNYFGDFCVWWGIFLVALATQTEEAWWSVIGPVTMSLILLRFFGAPMMEEHLKRTKPGYAEYARRTSAFFPRPPARSTSSDDT